MDFRPDGQIPLLSPHLSPLTTSLMYISPHGHLPLGHFAHGHLTQWTSHSRTFHPGTVYPLYVLPYYILPQHHLLLNETSFSVGHLGPCNLPQSINLMAPCGI
jgi:hypothetical protein